MLYHRVEKIFEEEMKGDTSFTEKESRLQLLFGGTRYSQAELRCIWNNAIKLGIEIGLRRANDKIKAAPENTEFLQEFYKLSEKYNCKISFHPREGMIVEKLT